MARSSCPFCPPPEDSIFLEHDGVACLWDAYPVTPGHALIIPQHHSGDWFELSEEDQLRLLQAADMAKEAIDDRYGPDGYNVGINSGTAAGQTVDHVHVHVIPRYAGDMEDPRGGVRHVIPSEGNYLESASERKDSA